MIDLTKNYIISHFQITETKNGKPMAKLIIECEKDSKEQYNCVIWQEILENTDKDILKQGNIIKINDIDYNEKFKTCAINSLKLVEKSKNEVEKEEAETYLAEIFDKIENFSDEVLKDAIKKVVFENLELFLISPAAEKKHHNYKGGLIRHLWECIKIAENLIPVISLKINEDLLFAGCIMHDFGKIFEYEVDKENFGISRNKNFSKQWINHIHWGFSWANNKNLPELAHIIASHHGLKEWGAIIEPNLPEANLVHQIDMISSRCGAISIKELNNINSVTAKK